MKNVKALSSVVFFFFFTEYIQADLPSIRASLEHVKILDTAGNTIFNRGQPYTEEWLISIATPSSGIVTGPYAEFASDCNFVDYVNLPHP